MSMKYKRPHPLGLNVAPSPEARFAQALRCAGKIRKTSVNKFIELRREAARLAETESCAPADPLAVWVNTLADALDVRLVPSQIEIDWETERPAE